MDTLQDILRRLSRDPRAAARDPKSVPARRPGRSLLLDAAAEPAPAGSYDPATHEQMTLSLEAVAALQQWLEDDDLEPGETSADRLLALVVGIADNSQDGELDDDEQAVADVVREAMWDYLSTLGVDDGDLSALLEDWDDAAAERVRDAALAGLPDGEFDPAGVVFGEADQEALFDAAYRSTWAVRGGKKVRIRKRVSGSVRLSGAQKMALRKARMKSHSAGARMRRMKSLRMRRRSGL